MCYQVLWGSRWAFELFCFLKVVEDAAQLLLSCLVLWGPLFYWAIWLCGVRLSAVSMKLSLLGMAWLCHISSFPQPAPSTYADPRVTVSSQQADLWAHIISKQSLKPLPLDPCMVFFPIAKVRLRLFITVACSEADRVPLPTSKQNGGWTEASCSSLKLSFTIRHRWCRPKHSYKQIIMMYLENHGKIASQRKFRVLVYRL